MSAFITVSTVIGAILLISLVVFVINFLSTLAVQLGFQIDDRNILELIDIIICSIICAVIVVVILYSTGVFK